jgi:TfoX/Sxy family transcriptional regulator of competence genes
VGPGGWASVAGSTMGPMAYDEELAERIRAEVAGENNLAEMKMFGGLAFLIGGNMAVGVSGQGGLMIRCDPDDTDELLAEPGAQPFEMRGKAMRGWLRVDADAVEDDDALRTWVERGASYARSLPPKQK